MVPFDLRALQMSIPMKHSGTITIICILPFLKSSAHFASDFRLFDKSFTSASTVSSVEILIENFFSANFSR